MMIETTDDNKVINMTRPDDWHLHVRDGGIMKAVVPETARVFGRAIIMPNLKPPIATAAMARKYYEEIRGRLPFGTMFEPLMTLYLTDNTDLSEITWGKERGIVHAVKYYPAGATTNSDLGVTDLKKTYAVLEEMQRLRVPLLVHGEVTDPEVDIFDREAVFIDRVLIPVLRDFPGLRVVFEHATTKDAVDFVMGAGENIAATITAHHLLLNRNDLLSGGIKPHYYCLPILKAELHRIALVEAATSGNKKFFLGTDSAPHERGTKENACGCAGSFTAPSAMELYAMAFDRADRLQNLERFASFHGADWYGLSRNTDTITLETVPTYHLDPEFHFGENGIIVPFMLKEGLNWRVRGRTVLL